MKNGIHHENDKHSLFAFCTEIRDEPFFFRRLTKLFSFADRSFLPVKLNRAGAPTVSSLRFFAFYLVILYFLQILL